MSKSLNILFLPIEGIGHVNANIGLAEVLIDRGHKVIFALNEQFKGRLTEYGIEEYLLTDDRPKDVDPGKYWAEYLIKKGNISDKSPLEKALTRSDRMTDRMKNAMKLDVICEELFNKYNPDVIFLDQFTTIPAIETSGIPWVYVWSGGPLMVLDSDETPPPASGLSALDDRTEWKQYREAVDKGANEPWIRFNDWVILKKAQPLKKNKYINDSPFLNIYGFPLELDYLDIRPLPPNWYRFDNLKRTDRKLKFEIPEQLRGKSGKLIYFSLGSMGAADVVNMKRLIGILGKSKHRFIVSKGPLHSEYSLADNMWGQQSVPQIQVLPLVSLVITHGGNNSITETFYFGKPMIVLPLFGDQYDNAQQIQDKGFGIRLDAYRCTESELLDGIEKLLNDKELNEKLLKISERIQTENSIGKLPKMIEDLVHKYKQ